MQVLTAKAVELSDSYRLPRLFLSYEHPAPFSPISFGKGPFSLTLNNYPKQPFSLNTEDQLTLVFGAPIVSGEINLKHVASLFREPAVKVEQLTDIDGEFLAIDYHRPTGRLRIVNDRFASIPIYYALTEQGLLASQYYSDLWRALGECHTRQLNEHAFFEFLWFQRLYGEKTYDTNSLYLPAASLMTYEDKKVTITRYWQPSFRKTANDIDSCASQLAELLRRSIREKTSDGVERVGLFLSGGLDSRTVLSAFEKPPVCFTLAVGQNNEFRVAHEAARIAGAEHIYLPLLSDPYSDKFEALVQLGGGMYVFDHALFLGFHNQISSKIDTVFHGHGVDYMFQGMYVPKVAVEFLGRTTHFSKQRAIATDVAEDYMNSISHRLVGVDLLNFVTPSHRDQMRAQLKEGISDVIKSGGATITEPADAWEYLLVHALSRHYPNTNLSSMSTAVEQRTVTFFNAIFDLYLSLPASHKLDAKIARAALTKLNPQLAKLRTGNTNFAANASPLEKQLNYYYDKALVKSGLRKQSRFYTPASERTWPERNDILRTSKALRNRTLALANSDRLSQLRFIDMNVLKRFISEWDSGKHPDAGKFLSFLITIDCFLDS